MKIRFKLRSVRGEELQDDISRTILVPNNLSLEDLHDIVFDVFNWIEKHSYSFHFAGEPFVTTEGEFGSPAHKIWNPVEAFHRIMALELNRHEFESFDEEEQFIQDKFIGTNFNKFKEEITDGDTVTLQELELDKGQTFVYVFDWGDMWIFDCEVVSTTGGVNKQYLIVEEQGELLPQYPEFDREHNEPEDNVPIDPMAPIGLEEFGKASNEKYIKIRNQLAKKREWIEKGEPGFDAPATGKRDIRCYRTPLPGSIVLIFSIPRDTSNINVVFNIDLLKAGIVDTMEIIEEPEFLLESLEIQMGIVRIKTKEAVFLLRRGYYMAKAVGNKVSKRGKKWLNKFGVLKKPMSKSPFRCSICEVRHLDDEDIDEIKALAKQEVKSGLINTDDEVIVDKICQRCHALVWD